ncbi:MAG: ABC transporter substrate-binding protein [Clostridia bacterium]|nr:ABC transporter substrate-binding protein [Clostridia bacterium]
MNKRIRRILTALMCVALLATMAVPAMAEEKVYHVGIVQLVEHNALDAATQGFQDALKEKLGDSVEFDYQNAQGEVANCATITTKFVNDGVDLIMANATPALTAACAATGEIPILGTSVTDYVSAGVLEDADNPGGNVSGTSDLAPIDQQIVMLQELCPEAKTVGIVYCSSEANSEYQANKAEEYLTAAGITVNRYTVSDSSEIQTVVTKAVSEVDCIYIPTDNTLADNMEIVKNITVPEKMPVIAGEENMCGVGGLATLSISYYDLGYVTGEMAYEILVEGANVGEMGVRYAGEVTKKYNAEIAEALGMTMPEDMVPIE